MIHIIHINLFFISMFTIKAIFSLKNRSSHRNESSIQQFFCPLYGARDKKFRVLRSSHTPSPSSRATLARVPRVARRNFIGHLLHVQYWLYESGSGWKPSNFPGFRFHDAMQIKQASSAVPAQTRPCPCKLHFFFHDPRSSFFLLPFPPNLSPQKHLITRLSRRGLFIIAIRVSIFARF